MKLDKGRCFECKTARQVTWYSAVDNVLQLMKTKRHYDIKLVQLTLLLHLLDHRPHIHHQRVIQIIFHGILSLKCFKRCLLKN